MPSEHEEHSERSPLLQSSSDADSSSDTPDSQNGTAKRLLVVILCIILSIVFEIGLIIANTALLQVQEDILCNGLHPLNGSRDDGLGDADPDDPPTRCEDREVQAELSIIRSWAVIFDLLPGLLMAVPFGLVADKLGRRLVLGLSVLGITASTAFQVLVCALPTVFPLRLVWLASAFNFIGGGQTVFQAIIHTILADVSNEAQRATTFFYLGAAAEMGAIAGGPVTYWLMIRGVWLSLFLALGSLLFCTMIGFGVPETLQRNLDEADVAVLEEEAEDPKFHSMMKWVRSGAKRFADFAYVLVTTERKVGMLVLSLLVSTFGRNAQILLQQYVKARFKWSWSEAGLVETVQSFCSLILLAVVLPLLTQALLRVLNPRLKDMWLARVSIVLQSIGSFVIGLAGSPFILIAGVAVSALGFGYNLLLRALMASLMSHDIATLFSAIAFLETATTIVASPLLAAVFRLGLIWGGPWLGLPYVASGFLFMGSLIIIASISVTNKEVTPGTDEAREAD